MRTSLQRFEEKYEIDAETGCWIWTAGCSPDGYAVFRFSTQRMGRGHVFAYERFVGAIPEGLHIDHLCRTRACVNPAHLEPVTPAENIRRSPIALATRNRLKTHCKRGHPLSGENLYLAPSGRRVCRACMKMHITHWRENNRETAVAATQDWYWRNAEARRAYGREYMRRRRAEKKASVMQSPEPDS